MEHRVTVIGAGNLGRSLATALSRRGSVSVRAWDKNPSIVPGQGTLTEALADTEAVLLCVPSWAFAEALATVLPVLPSGAVVTSFSKGVEGASGRFMLEVMGEALPPGQPWAVVTGPMLAAEVLEGLPAFGVAASTDPAAAAKVAAVFAGTNLRMETSDDPLGVAVLGVLKNVYSLGLGMTEALGWEGNSHGWYVAQAVTECAMLLGRAGARPETAYGLAGVGDLVATGFSRLSRNRAHGQALVQGRDFAAGSEGFASVERLVTRLGAAAEKAPLLTAIAAAVRTPHRAGDIFAALVKAR